jgi:hypothetical protein
LIYQRLEQVSKSNGSLSTSHTYCEFSFYIRWTELSAVIFSMSNRQGAKSSEKLNTISAIYKDLYLSISVCISCNGIDMFCLQPSTLTKISYTTNRKVYLLTATLHSMKDVFPTYNAQLCSNISTTKTIMIHLLVFFIQNTSELNTIWRTRSDYEVWILKQLSMKYSNLHAYICIHVYANFIQYQFWCTRCTFR